MKPLNTIAFVVNKQKPTAEAFAEQLEQRAEALGVTAKISTSYPLDDEFLKGQDACCSIGGDGTLLSVIHQCTKHKVPIFGVNHGKLGFLATFSEEDIKEHLHSLVKGNYDIQSRCMLECITAQSDIKRALNDIVIKQPSLPRLMSLKVYFESQLVNDYFCDGLIFSTATGSTAYNLSAGGPIIYPGSKVFALTPICSHTLTNRSVIFDKDYTLEIQHADESMKLFIYLDGQNNLEGTDLFPITIRVAEEPLQLLLPKHYSHFHILRNKLKW